MLKISYVILTMVSVSLYGFENPHESYKKALNNTEAVQTWYVDGAPHTDAQGNRRMKYDPEKSFFPIGMWGVPFHDPAASYDWQELVNLGCNTVWPWQTINGNGLKTLNTADKFNFQIIFQRKLPDKDLREIAGHKRLLGNCWHDEPIGKLQKPGWMEKEFKNFTEYKKKANQLAPSMAVFINDAPWISPPATEWFYRWNTAGDIVCHDNYPTKISSSNTKSSALKPNGIAQTTVLTTIINKSQKPNWVILGAFEQGFIKGKDRFPFRFSTPDQLRSQVYTALVHGATGIYYFIWDSFISRDGNVLGISPDPQTKPARFRKNTGRGRPMTPIQKINSKALWDTVKQLNHELKTLTPAILSPTVDPKTLSYNIHSSIIAGDKVAENPIRGLLKTTKTPNEYILLNVNMDAVTTDTLFQFDREIDEVKNMFESYPLPIELSVDKRSFCLRYEPFQAHILKLRFNENSKIKPIDLQAIKTIDIPIPKAIMMPAGKITAKLVDNPVSQTIIIQQPMTKGMTSRSVQWNNPTYVTAEANQKYEMWLEAKVDDKKFDGELLTIGWCDKANEKVFIKKTIPSDELSCNQFKWIKIGELLIPETKNNATTIYIAPSKVAPAENYYIKTLELRKMK
jgi:hypothetical protein